MVGFYEGVYVILFFYCLKQLFNLFHYFNVDLSWGCSFDCFYLGFFSFFFFSFFLGG